jgi:tritrans,polycis-undecaprenyl-diphosphate synthase [geranylgeranyl-diphosphate specific]
VLKRIIGKRINDTGRYAIKNDFVRRLVSTIYHSSFFKKVTNRLDEMMDCKMLEEVKKHKLPEHIAIIMDGNRRFADKLDLDHNMGHLLGRNKFEEVVEWCFSEMGIKVLTVYAFSTENLKRDEEEVGTIMRLCAEELENGVNDHRVHDKEICIRVMGHLESLPKEVQNAANLIMDKTKNYNKHFLNIALAYGGRQDILQAIQRIASDVQNEKLELGNIDGEIISSYLYTNGLPDPDLILRTSGEERLSNFLLWQAAHSDLYFADVYWPAFQKRDFLKAIKAYQQRKHNLSI